MKQITKYLLLILLTLISYTSISQTVTPTVSDRLNITQIDSSYMILETHIVRLMVKDIVRGDYALKEVSLLKEQNLSLYNKISLQDQIITNLTQKNNNYNSLLGLKEEEINLISQFNEKLQRDLKIQKNKTLIVGGVGVVSIVAILLLK